MSSNKTKILFLAVIVCIFGLWLYINIAPPPQFKAVFLNIGQGDSVLIFLENGAKILVDCGPDRTILRKLNERLRFFDRQIEYLLVTHPDLDHYGGCIDVLQHYEVKNIFINGAQKDDQIFATWQKYLEKEGAEVFVIEKPITYILDKARLKFISPDPDFIDDKTGDNDKSLVFKFFYNTITIFFTADMEEKIEKELIKKYCFDNFSDCPELKSDYLKVGHHGSDSSSGKDFLQAVSPHTAIISSGKNSFGHPSLRVLKRLERENIEIWRTDRMGDIIVK